MEPTLAAHQVWYSSSECCQSYIPRTLLRRFSCLLSDVKYAEILDGKVWGL